MKSITIQEYRPQTLTRTWGTETLIAETPDYIGKLLRYKRGHAGGLQKHRTKIESFYLVEGSARIDYDDGDGNLVSKTMNAGETYHIPAGAPHRFYAQVDCLVFEVSTPVHNDRVRLEEEYGVEVIGDTYGLPTTEAPNC